MQCPCDSTSPDGGSTLRSKVSRFCFMMNLKGRTKMSAATKTLVESEIHSPNLVLSLACCPMDVEMSSTICSKKNASTSTSTSHGLYHQNQSATDEAREETMYEAMKGEYSTEHKQDGDVGSVVTEEFTSSVMGVSGRGRQSKREAVPFKDWPRSMENNHRYMEGKERGMRVVSGSGGESDGCENLRRYFLSMEQAGKLPSSQYKGVVAQPNGRWGAQIYEKHQRVWLGTFNMEEDAAKTYDRAALKFRGQDAMTNFRPAGDGDPEYRFMKEYNKEQIVNMLRKHTYDEEFEHHRKRIVMTAGLSGAMNNSEASGSEGSGQRAHACQENQAAIDGNGNTSTSTAAMAGLPRQHLFDKAVTPSDVGKLNRLVIPKLHAEKHFPLDVNTREKGLLLSFGDNTGKVWRFRYSYWKSSQSYVLTKGWSRFVKDKKMEAGDIVSFEKELAQPCQLYISWRRRPSRQLRLGTAPQSHQYKGALMYPGNILSSLDPFHSQSQPSVVYNAQWMPIFWSGSSNPDPFTESNSNSVSPLINRVSQVVAKWPQRPATHLNGGFPFYFSEPPTKQRDEGRFYKNNPDGLPTMDSHGNLSNSLNSGEEITNIKPLHPFVNRAKLSAAQELETPEYQAASTVDPETKKEVRLFGVTLAGPQRSS